MQLIIRKDILDKFPFDNETTNIEDRLWGQQMRMKGTNYYIHQILVFITIMGYIKMDATV